MSPQSDCNGYEFAAGSVRGVRAWRVDPLGRLTGVSFPQVWTPGENVAKCMRRPTIDSWIHAAYGNLTLSPATGFQKAAPQTKTPLPDTCDGNDPVCPCGFYAYHDGVSDYVDSVSSFTYEHNIHGVIDGYGRASIGPRGFRAQRARILALAVPAGTPRAAQIRRNYAGIPVFADYDEMLAEFPPDPSFTPSPETDPDFWTRTA